MTAVSTTPAGFHSITPYLTIKGAAAAIEFYKKAFAATEVLRLEMGPGVIGHAEIKIGNSHVMLSDEFPDMGMKSPQSIGGTGGYLMIYTDDCDAMIAQAVAAGAKIIRAAENHFYGDRNGQIEDPFGHRWAISTHVEDVSNDEIKRRMDAMMGVK